MAPFERGRSVGIAILVGVGKYPRFSGFGELQYPERDVELLDKELTTQHYQVISLADGDATKESILNAISQAEEAIDPDRNGSIIFSSPAMAMRRVPITCSRPSMRARRNWARPACLCVRWRER
jgi:hypothetical protein